MSATSTAVIATSFIEASFDQTSRMKSLVGAVSSSAAGRLRADCDKRVITNHGATTLTPIGWPASIRSAAKVSASAVTAAFDALYAANPGWLMYPASEPVMHTCPGRPAAIMRGTNERTQ